MSIINWQAQAIIDAVHSNLDTAKSDIGLTKVVKKLDKNVDDIQSLKDFVADGELPYLYVGIQANAFHDMRHETNVGIETDLHVVLLGIAHVEQDVALPDTVDGLVEKLWDYIYRTEFLEGTITETIPEGYMTTHEALWPLALFQLNFIARYTWLHDPNP